MRQGIKSCVLIAVLCPALAPAVGLAGAFSYNYVEGGLAIYPDAPAGQTWVGFDSRVAVEIGEANPNMFAFGGLMYLTDDVDYTAIHAGLGYRHGIQDDTDIWGGVTIERQDFDPGGQDSSLGLRGGIRHQVDEVLEFAASARVITGDADYVGGAATIRYLLTDDLSFLGEIDVLDGDFGFIGGVSLAF